MKQHIYAIASAVAMMLCAYSAEAQAPNVNVYRGVGPAIAGSTTFDNLPKAAQKFVQENFGHQKVTACEREFDSNTYEVTLSDGTEIEFDSNGQWIEVESAKRKTINPATLGKMLPSKAHKELSNRSIVNKIESVKQRKNSYKVDVHNDAIDEIIFDINGEIISIVYDY